MRRKEAAAFTDEDPVSEFMRLIQKKNQIFTSNDVFNSFKEEN